MDPDLAVGACAGAAWLEEAARLHREGREFVLATVVAREAPQSARSGAKALVLPDGRLVGWVGGGCVRPTVIRESLAALRDGEPRLLRINPGAEPDPRPEVRVFAMTCQGEGAVDIYLEPVLPPPELLVYGRTPVAEALAELARPLGFEVRRGEPGAPPAGDGSRSFVVVATMGEGDEEALEAALAGDARYLGLVASRKKGAALFAYLRGRGILEPSLARVKCPAGLDLGGVTPAEVALSILAEIVQAQRAPRAALRRVPAPALAGPAPEPEAPFATDPVCGMAVEVATARHTLEHEGRTHYFCCPHCKAHFARDPARYQEAV